MSSHPERYRRWAGAAVAAAVLTLAVAAVAVVETPDPVPPPKGNPPRRLGLQFYDPRAFDGYTLVAPLNGTRTYLIDMFGRVVRMWESRYTAGQDAYLLENGHLLRAATLDPSERHFAGSAQGGRVQEFDWDGHIVWDFKFHDERRVAHHDVCRLPNGNVLLIVWEIRTADEAIAAGRRPGAVRGPWLADSIVEVRPTGETTGEVVWEWHAWDHLIQDADPSKADYGDVGRHPERIDVNFGCAEMGSAGGPAGGNSPHHDVAAQADAAKEREMDRLRSIGYVGTPAAPENLGLLPDWTHVNSVAYNAELDQVMISVRSFGEFWIIDHGTTTAEAAGHSGGRRGKGGDLLYRWGNPLAYRAGTRADQRLFAQHDAQWIPKGYPGAGHVLVFNNGSGRPAGRYSSVDEIVLSLDARGNDTLTPGEPFGPREPAWSYTAPRKEDLYSFVMSGANRLPNGDTLICESVGGTIFEVTPEGETVWMYRNPAGPDPPPGPPGPLPSAESPTLADVLPPMFRSLLDLTPDQRAKLDAAQKEVDGRLETILDAPQKKRLLERRASDPMGVAGMAAPGQLLPLSTQVVLRLSADQKAALAALHREVAGKVEAVLDGDQKEQMQQLRTTIARGGTTGSRPGGPGGPSHGPGSRPLGRGTPPIGPPGRFGNSVFRAYRYARDYPGLAGKDLTPGKTIEELEHRRPG